MESKKRINRNFFVKKGRSWWENLSEEEKKQKTEENRIAGKKGAESRWKNRVLDSTPPAMLD